MFQINWSDADSFWLNVTNAGLGLVTLVCFLAVVYAVGREALERLLKRAPRAVAADDHAFDVPGLGLTMADGGEQINKNEDKKR